LRLVMADQSVVDEAALKRLGARGMIRPSATALQVVVGTDADQVAGEMKIALRAAGVAAATSATDGATAAGRNATRTGTAQTAGVPLATNAPADTVPAASGTIASASGSTASQTTTTRAPTAPPLTAAPPIPTPILTSLLSALGGRANVRAIETASTRLRINVVDPKAVNESAIVSLGLRGVAQAAPNWVHVIVGPDATTAGASLRQLL
jgi:PTS system N-acetylglucosamine-specific IIC component